MTGAIHFLAARGGVSQRALSSVLILALWFALSAVVVPQALAQSVIPPERGEPIRSMGLHQTWKPHAGALLDWERRGGENRLGGEILAGVYRDLANPNLGVFGLVGEGYARGIEGLKPDGGFRLGLESPFFAIRLAADYSIRDDDLDFVFSLKPWIRRGGPFGRGGHMRIDWYPGRNHSLSVGFVVPVGQPYMGKTRPKSDHVRVPSVKAPPAPAFTPDAELTQALDRIRHAAAWIGVCTTPFMDQAGGTDESHIAEFEGKLARFKEHIHLTDDDYPDAHTYAAEIAAYHRELERAFSLALGATAGDDRGARIAAICRDVLLDEVILPYDRLLGQRKTHDTLSGYGANATRVFRAKVELLPEVPPARRPAVHYVFDEMVEILEENRQRKRETWGDSRLVWVPLHYALRLEDHDSQAEIDALLERALTEEFTSGNQIDYVINELFQIELHRMILAAEDYHVLWIHDFRGVNNAGEPDRIAYGQTVLSYLEALIQRVEAYDETRRIPAYIVILDQFYYQTGEGWLFLKLLEDPLANEIDLPEGYAEWEETIRGRQDELRAAVRRSEALQAGRDLYGEAWLHRQIKVHVNITNPPDFSFRSNHLIPKFPFFPDIMLRDHRKISFYDITELDPGKGEAIFTGVGVGEHYSGPTWDDRSLLVRGPALVRLKDAARELFLSQGFKPDDIPLPLRPLPKPLDYAERVAALEAQGWRAHALQVHNATGYGDKWCNVVKGVLYELMPAGSHIYVPDSLWNSALWAGMLCGAALRGCWVFPISPAVQNAPSAGAPQMSRANEIFTRFVVVQERLQDEIAAAGGMLRTGVYNLNIDLGDGLGKLRLINSRVNPEEMSADAQIFRTIAPFDDSVYELLHEYEAELAAHPTEPVYLTEDVEDRKPKLHLKNQLFLSKKAVETLIPEPGWSALVLGYMKARQEQLTRRKLEVHARDLRAALAQDATKLAEAWWQGLTPEERDQVAFYLTIGSQNEDYRGTIMDGEVLCVVAGLPAMNAYLDFVSLMATTTWVDDIEQLEKLLPRQSGFTQQIARWIKNAL